MTTRTFDEPPPWMIWDRVRKKWLPAIPPPTVPIARLAVCNCEACKLARTPTLKLRTEPL